jgi:hypothetical protein
MEYQNIVQNVLLLYGELNLSFHFGGERVVSLINFSLTLSVTDAIGNIIAA